MPMLWRYGRTYRCTGYADMRLAGERWRSAEPSCRRRSRAQPRLNRTRALGRPGVFGSADIWAW